jgi:hypothetical protein
MNIDSNLSESLQRLGMDRLLPSFQAINPLPIKVCHRMLAAIPPEQTSFLATISLRLFAGFTIEETGRAEWGHIVLEEGVIWDPCRLAWRPLYGAHSWLAYNWNPGATGKIAEGLMSRMAALKWEILVRKMAPTKCTESALEDTHRAYCVYPNAFPSLAQNDPALWKKLQVYRLRGELLQRLSPSVVYRLKKTRLDDPISNSTGSSALITSLHLV